ncbi:MAG: TetR/AcrR family transcriptional regulator [Actinomycetota bacterium]|nr:TetR/AcrR family transcriptional regulator [Actinomycetota bacterium]
MAKPAYRRLDVDERRAQLLRRGAQLFAKHGYAALSMAKIARAAGISKALLYHYFPSKRAFFAATLAQAADELRRRTDPDPSLPPFAQLRGSLEAFLSWVEENAEAYEQLMLSANTVSDVRELIDTIRELTAQRILAGLAPADPPPRARTAVRAWLWFMDGACLDWLHHRDIDRGDLLDLLVNTLSAALEASGVQIPDPEGYQPRNTERPG